MGLGGQPHAPAASTPGKDHVPIVQEAGWTPGPVWTGGKSRPHRDSIPDRAAPSQSLYRLSHRPININYHFMIQFSITGRCWFAYRKVTGMI